MKMDAALLAFNRGLIDPLALARADLKRTALSAEMCVNWMPRTLGPMMLRPGMEYITTSCNDVIAKHIPFVFSVTDTAILEFTDSVMRVLIDDVPISRVSVSSTITNGTFDTNLTGWTDNDEVGATSAWATGGYMSLLGTGVNAAIRDQQVTVASGDMNKEHALRVIITQGVVALRVGSTSGGDEYIAETTLYPGIYSLALTPTGDFYVRLFNRNKYAGIVDSVAIESSGTLELPTTWVESDLANLRWKQSGDVVFVACKGQQQRRIERRATRSWSFAKYMTDDGPFLNPNTGPIRIAASAVSGNVTLTATKPLFRSTHVGALFMMASTGQEVSLAVSGEDQWTNPIRVSGISTGRQFTVAITGTFSGTVRLQRSVGAPGVWTNVAAYAVPITFPYNDTYDNQIIYYRIGIAVGEYTSGTADVSLIYAGGSITGVARVTEFASNVSVSAEVLEDMGSTDSTDDWSEGAWSDRRGWPSAVELHEGRLWWAGKDKINGSISDSYHSFNPNYEGDAGPISRSIGQGPVDTINWLASSKRLIIGGQGQEFVAMSSTIDEPLTPLNFKIDKVSSQGSAALPSVSVDGSVAFVQRGGYRLFEMKQGDSLSGYDTENASQVVPNIGSPGIVRIAVQRQPDTRIHCVRSDGTVAVLVDDHTENVRCWVEVETDGEVVDVLVLPGESGGEDDVYYQIKRTINYNDHYYLEKWARENEAIGGAVNKQADSFYHYSGASATVITGLDHLEGRDVVAWGNSKDLGDYTVSGGSITLTEAVTEVTVGLGYQARWKGSKLSRDLESGIPSLLRRMIISRIGLLLMNTHAQGLRYGPDFDNMDELPVYEKGEAIDGDYVWDQYDNDLITFPGEWDTDSRICLEANAPRPATVLAVIVDMEKH